MKASAIFSLAALIPAALGSAPAAMAITAKLCTATGEVRLVTIPLGNGAPVPAGENAPCCAKGCHASGSRKRLTRQI